MVLFNDFEKKDKLDESSRRRVVDYIKKYQVTQKQLFEMSKQFPARAIKKMIENGVIQWIYITIKNDLGKQ